MWLTPNPLFVPATTGNRQLWAKHVQSVGSKAALVQGVEWLDVRLDPQPFRTPGVAVQCESNSGRAYVWTHAAICRLWGILSPVPQTVTLASDPVLDCLGWATTFAVLLGRGKVVIADQSWNDRLAAVDGEGVLELHIRSREIGDLLASAGIHRTPKKVTIWSQSPVSLGLMDAIASHFPNAEIRRCLHVEWAPISIASLPDLHRQGESWLGEPVLGVEFLYEQSERITRTPRPNTGGLLLCWTRGRVARGCRGGNGDRSPCQAGSSRPLQSVGN